MKKQNLVSHNTKMKVDPRPLKCISRLIFCGQNGVYGESVFQNLQRFVGCEIRGIDLIFCGLYNILSEY